MMPSAFRKTATGQLYVEQSADDILDYGFNAADLFPAGDTIQSAIWASVNVTVTAPETSGTVTTAFVAGTDGSVSATVTSAAGRRKRVDFLVRPPA